MSNVVIRDGQDIDVARFSPERPRALVLPGFDEASRAASAATLLRLGARLHAALGRRIPLVYGADPQLPRVAYDYLVEGRRPPAPPRTVYDAFAWDDPKPFARWASSFLTRKVAGHALRDHRGHSR
ncbi:hypothetical protein WME97_25475 [Sorangium sp. So ce367]|uniref:hypothetical protein n=1 Tax=Sorangium sp. So ce367 TaxID=3133305 RepID=UPI003F5DD476